MLSYQNGFGLKILHSFAEIVQLCTNEKSVIINMIWLFLRVSA
jgi:hypothetical protein